MPAPEALDAIINRLTPKPILDRATTLLQNGDPDQALALAHMVTDLMPVERGNQRSWLPAAFLLQQQALEKLDQGERAGTVGVLLKVADALKDSQPQLISQSLVEAVNQVGMKGEPAQLRFLSQAFRLQADMMQAMADNQLLNG